MSEKKTGFSSVISLLHQIVTTGSADRKTGRGAHDPALHVSAPLNSALLNTAPHVSAPKSDTR